MTCGGWISERLGGELFKGSTIVSLDVKGRLAVPTKFRDGVKSMGALVLTGHQNRCLALYPKVIFDTYAQQLHALPEDIPVNRARQLIVLGHADDVELDSADRILIAQPLREFAYLDKEVLFVGQGNRFEIWDTERWRQCIDEATTLTGPQLPKREAVTA